MSFPAAPPPEPAPEPPPGPRFEPAPSPPAGPRFEPQFGPPPPGPPFGPPFGRPPRPPHRAPPWILAAVIFTLSTVLPSLFFLSAGYDEDPTASETVNAGTMAWLIGAEVVIGIVLAAVAVGWFHALRSAQVARGVVTVVMIAIATASGFVTGFLGAVAIAYERHPTWDDA